MKWILNFVYAALLLALTPVILWRLVRHGRYRQGTREKFLGQLPRFSQQKTVVWFHAVSVGEILQLEKLIESFCMHDGGNSQILITTSTDTGYELARQRFSDHTVSWFPLDFSWAVSSAIRRVQPSLVVLVELELWPNFLRECQRQDIPTSLINARMSDRSFPGYTRIRRVVRPLLSSLSVVAAQTEEYAERLITLGANPARTTVTGSIKFDGVCCDANNPQTNALRQLLQIDQQDLVFIAGSTQAPEEQFAIDAWRIAQADFPSLRLILVPRHRERFDEVAALVDAAGLPCVRRSTLTSDYRAVHGSVVVLDTIGELSGCWGLADVAFVGGSLGSRGGQNMLEPAAYGAAVMFGPNTSNFKDIVQQLLQQDAAVQLQSGQQMADELVSWLKSAESRTSFGLRAQQMVLQQQGAIEKTVHLLLRVHPKDAGSARIAA